MSFSDEWAKESEAAIMAVEETVKVTAIELFSGVIFRTPVGNKDLWKNPNSADDGYTGGSARSNWFLTFTTPSTQTTTSTDRENGSRDSFYGEIASKVSSQRGGDNASKYILTNNLSYIERLDSNWSTQTGGLGIVSPEESRVSAMIPRIAKAANKKYGVE